MKPFWPAALMLICAIACPANAQVRVLIASSTQTPTDIGGQGYAYELTQAIAHRAGYTRDFERMPWARALSIAEAGPDVLLLSVVRTPARESHFQWLIPLLEDDYVLVSQQPIDLETVSQRTIGVLRGSVVIELAKHLGYTHLDIAGDDQQNLQRLRAGRCDVWMVGRVPGLALIRRSGLKAADFYFSPSLQHLDVYLAASLDFDRVEARRWQAAYEAIRIDGTLNAIRRRYQIE